MLFLATRVAWADMPSPTDAAGVGSVPPAQTVVHLLDYVAADYPGFVRDGQVLNPTEYAEQREFSTQAAVLLAQLPTRPEQPALIVEARQLAERVAARAPGDDVAGRANHLRAGVIHAWQLSVAPRRAPVASRGVALFAAQCAGCHGAQGFGDGPLAAGLTPAPRNFHDDARLRRLSLYGLYNTLALGVSGTAMRAFPELSEDDRWALAFHVADLRASAAERDRGARLWRAGTGRAIFPSLKGLVTRTPDQQAPAGSDGDAVRQYLTATPGALVGEATSPLAFARARLDDTLAAYARGERNTARQLAIAAYLEGFDLVESALNNVDAGLRTRVEHEMMGLRNDIAANRPLPDVQARVGGIQQLIGQTDRALNAHDLPATTAFASSLLILLREGLEAILVLSAICAFVIRAGRRDALVYIHAGWLGAVALGALTWVLARFVIDLSGANRELTSGVTAMVAAAMLLYVGWWLHSRSTAQAWNAFIRDTVNAALNTKTLWTMAGISFLAVYRELFEVVLFYESLWQQAGPSGQGAVLWGIGAAAVGLAVVGWAILRYSVRLPIGPFFQVASLFLAVMAVVFVGNGVKALQEAGVLSVTPVSFVTFSVLGVYPTAQGLLAQLVVLALIGGGLWFNREAPGAARLPVAKAG